MAGQVVRKKIPNRNLGLERAVHGASPLPVRERQNNSSRLCHRTLKRRERRAPRFHS